jgi:hypothetical protein
LPLHVASGVPWLQIWARLAAGQASTVTIGVPIRMSYGFMVAPGGLDPP